MASTDNTVQSIRWKRWIVITSSIFGLICLILCLGVFLQFMNIFRALGFGALGALDRARAAQEAGDLDSALHWANVAVKRNGHFQETYYRRGSVQEALGKLPEAIEDYSQAIKYDQVPGGYFVDRGRVYEKLGQTDVAVREYCKGIQMHPDSKFGPQRWAEQRAEREGPDTLDEMIAVFDSAIENDPNNESFTRCRQILANAQRFPRDNKTPNLK